MQRNIQIKEEIESAIEDITNALQKAIRKHLPQLTQDDKIPGHIVRNQDEE